jgi:hypothetical protein
MRFLTIIKLGGPPSVIELLGQRRPAMSEFGASVRELRHSREESVMSAHSEFFRLARRRRDMSENVTVDSELGEVLQKNQGQLAQQIAAVQRDGICLQGQGKKQWALRNVHPKAHGCVRAEFRVDEHLPPHLAQGVFVSGNGFTVSPLLAASALGLA